MDDLYLRFNLRVEVGDIEIQTCIYAYGRRKDFSRERPIMDFQGVAKNIFAGWSKSEKNSFNHSKLRKQPFFKKIDKTMSNFKMPAFSDAHAYALVIANRN